MGIRVVQADAFADRPFEGNPAAVCVLDAWRDEHWMQAVAAEMNLSETAFLVREGDGYRLRWFTPLAEVALCGHATLASAHVLWEECHLAAAAPARFHTRSGTLTATREAEWIEMDFPALRVEACPVPEGLATALGAEPVCTARAGTDLLVELASETAVRELAPDVSRLGALPSRGVIVTARADGTDVDIVSRFFAPRVGVPEDPVTGSAHCALAPFWAERLGRRELVGYQASRRGGLVGMRLRGERVTLRGKAVTTLRGELVLP